MDSENRGKLIRQRWRKNTLREVYFNDDRTVTKRFWVRPGTRRYPKPWLAEHKALLKLDGLGFPKTYGLKEQPFERGQEILFVRDFVEGHVMGSVSIEDAAKLGKLMACMHGAGVVADDAALDNFVKNSAGEIQCIDFGCAKVFSKHDPRKFYVAGEELNKLWRKTLHENQESWKIFTKSYFSASDLGLLSQWVVWSGYGVSRFIHWLRKDALKFKWIIKRHEFRYGIPPCKEKSYEKGRLLVHPALDCLGALEAYISKLEFLELPEENRLYTHNKRYRVYAFHLAAAERDVILKVSWANPEYSPSRRRNIQFLQWFKNYSKIAFFGALALQKIGIRTITPLAYWNYSRTPLNIDSYFLYEKRPAISSALDVARDVAADPTPDNQAKLNAIIDRMSDITRCLHEHRFRHDDIAIGNFLVELGDETAPESDPVRRYNVAMIDTDHITFSHTHPAWLKRFFDLRDLRRLNLDDKGQHRFINRYLGEKYSNKWWSVYKFWKKWGKNPVQKFAKNIISRGKTERLKR